MKARGLTDNIEGNEPAQDAPEAEKKQYERNEGKTMNFDNSINRHGACESCIGMQNIKRNDG